MSPVSTAMLDLSPPDSLGVSRLMCIVQDQAELQVVWDGLCARLTADANDAGALRDASILLLMTGHAQKGLELQARAISLQPCYRVTHGSGGGLRILAFMAAGDLMANTPLDFLLETSDAELIVYYLDGPPPSPELLPPHDVAFLAIGQSDRNAELLESLRGAFDDWPRPVINGAPELIAEQSREWVAAELQNEPSICCPPTVRLTWPEVAQLAIGLQSGDLPAGLTAPLNIRPVDSHAGRDLERISDVIALADYLGRHPESEFYVSSFIDYSGPDGLYRKLRIVFIEGRPFISHMAVSENWMVHYLNAGMGESEAKRAEEAALMARFDEEFVPRNARALAAICEHMPLDYFGIDCAEMRDGRLLVFEADVAMIVHAQDPVDLFPYKQPAMAKLFAAFLAMCAQRAQEGEALARLAS